MDSKRSSETKLLYCTTGVVLRRLQEDRDLEGVTHVRFLMKI
jgi:HrpA-like RNA helicase